VIIDAHTHSWPRWPYPPAVPQARSRGAYQNLIHEMDAAGVGTAVVVSAALAGQADNNEYAAAAVSACPGRLRQFVDVDSRWSPAYHTAGAAGRLAELTARLSPAGVSHYLAAGNDGWLRSAEGRAFFAEAGRQGLAISLAATPAWFADICELAASVPGTPVLLNHLALAMTVSDGLDVVRHGAARDNLIVKVSGYYYGSDRPWDYPFTGQLEVVRAFYQAWGPRRMVWGSDYPASTPHITYRQSLEVLREHASFIDPADLPLVLGGTMAGILGCLAVARPEPGSDLRTTTNAERPVEPSFRNFHGTFPLGGNKPVEKRRLISGERECSA
jgi:L-fuconolactonase